jgi:proton-dependent oligopeptide transporter, POT family
MSTASPPETSEAAKDADKQALADVKQLGLVAAIGSLSYVFWVVGGMEMVERCAFYGVRAVSGLYANAPVSEGGLGIDEDKLGTIFLIWALFQSLLPVFTGGLSDRYGYKETIFVSTVVKIAGYLIMGVWPTFMGFLIGALVLATGTAIFKPGIQGTLVNATSRENSSMAWGIFYQTVNIGGWMGPLVAAFMRTRWGWHSVFYINAAIIGLNFILLVTYKEPKKALRLERAEQSSASGQKQESLWKESLRELAKTHVWLYLLIFSGFWFMFYSLFDVLPLHIRDWVNTQQVVDSLFGAGGTRNVVFKFLLGMNKEGTAINPEGMLNLNAGLIMVTCFLFAYASSKLRATTSMVVGTLLATTAMFMSGYSTLGWLSVAAILTFSVGEMLSSPKFSEFIGNFAPAGKKAMYLGFSQMSLAVGWTAEGKLGPKLYGIFASKENFSRDLLLQRGMPQADVNAIKQGEAFDALVRFTHETPAQLTKTLHDSHHVGAVWLVMGGVGILSAIFIYAYGRWILTLTRSK